MDSFDVIRRLAERLNAIENRRCFRVSSQDSGRSIVVDLMSWPDQSIVVNVETVATSGHAVEGIIRDQCDCAHNDRGGSHLRCDYLALTSAGLRSAVVYIEVKTGINDEHGDVAHGFKQIMCSKVVFETVLSRCGELLEHVDSFGVVVSPAFALSRRNQRQSAIWSAANGLRLIQVRSGEDLWAECIAS